MRSVETIGLETEQRKEQWLREIFVEAFDAVSPFMDEGGGWLSFAHEILADDALSQRFPELDGGRKFVLLASVASVRASGRVPVDAR